MRARRSLCGIAVLASVVTCASQTAPTVIGSDTTLLADSEIHYVESGGFAGRTREAQLAGSNGRVTARYRPDDVRGTVVLMEGAVESARYLELWREADRLDLWTLSSMPKSKGADMVQYEFRIRLGTRSHVIRWDDGTTLSSRLRDVAAFGQRVLSLAREVTTYR